MAAVDNAPPAPVVTVTSTRTVAPAAAKCVLATFDLPYITFYYNQKLLLYRLPNGASDFPDAVARMSASLSDALAYFYPLAGRIRQDDHDGSLSIHGQHGAEVIEASADHVSVDQLAGEECSEEAEKVMQLLVPYTGVMNLEGLNRPLLAVQLTRLRDGVAVGCAFNHAVLDGTSTWHFMTSWAELCRGGGAPSLLPVHNRGMARSVRVNLPLPASAEAHEKTDPNGPKEYEAAPKLFHYSDAGPNCVAVGSSPRFRVYDVDFGFGRPERVRSGANNKFDGMVYLYPGRGGDGGIDVELSLQPEPMQRLDKDQDFLQMRAP
uniref:BAHD acyltransferase DCR n=1 Tax=Oryza barthii TaxID=65489 RepID=A0A0D3H396_9ORYZ